jgi:hypothetical protein
MTAAPIEQRLITLSIANTAPT